MGFELMQQSRMDGDHCWRKMKNGADLASHGCVDASIGSSSQRLVMPVYLACVDGL